MKRRVVALVCAMGCGTHEDLVPPDAPPDATLRPARIVAAVPYVHFGDVVVGGESAPATISFSNTGDEPSQPLAPSIAPAGAFRVTSSTCAGLALPAYNACSVVVVARPPVPGLQTAVLTVADAPVPLEATAVGEEGFTVSPSTWTFADASPGQTGGTHAFTVTNIGGHAHGPMSLVRAGSTPDDFVASADTCTGATLGGGESCTFSVTFVPTGLGARSATFQVLASPASTPLIGVSGNAISDGNGFITANPSSLGFGAVGVGGTAMRSFVITNQGAGSTGAIAMSMTGSAAFSTASTCPALANGESCTIDVTFAPSATGDAQAQVHVTPTSGGGVVVPAAGTGS